MSHPCDICGSILSSVQTLKTHRKTAKKCLRLQTDASSAEGPEVESSMIVKPKNTCERIDCQLCHINILKYKYKRHLGTCKNFDHGRHEFKNGVVWSKTGDGLLELKTSAQISEENRTLKQTIDDLKQTIDGLKQTIDEQRTTIIKFREKALEIENKFLKETLSEQKQELDRRTKVLEKKISEPTKSVNNNYGVVQHYLSKPIDLEGKGYRDIVNKKLELSHIKAGEVGIANFVLDELIRDKETKEIYMVCCDEKKTLKYMKTDGVMVTDKGGKFFLQTMKKKLIPFVNMRITDLVDALPEEEKEKYHKLYGKIVVLGYAFSEHVAARTYVNKDGGVNPFRDQCEIKVITDTETKMATKRMKDDRKDRRKMVEMEEKDAEEESPEIQYMRAQDRKTDQAREVREERKKKKDM